MFDNSWKLFTEVREKGVAGNPFHLVDGIDIFHSEILAQRLKSPRQGAAYIFIPWIDAVLFFQICRKSLQGICRILYDILDGSAVCTRFLAKKGWNNDDNTRVISQGESR